MIEEVRAEKQSEFIKMKYDAAIAKFESEGEDSERAKYIQEFQYKLVGLQREFNEGEIQRRYQLLCTKLKFLYVAITRPKLRLFIYDENTEARKPLEALWMKLGAVQRITKDALLAQQEEKRLAKIQAQAN